MTLANEATELQPIADGERTEHELVRPWHELEYALLVADSDRILADALTPRTVVLLNRVATAPAGPPHPSPPSSEWWTVTAPPAPDVRAPQRSPPRSQRNRATGPGECAPTRGQSRRG